jgi:hypothetical protein
MSSGRKQPKGGHQAGGHSDHMVFVMARQGGLTVMRWWPMTLKTKQGILKKGDVINDTDDDDEVRTVLNSTDLKNKRLCLDASVVYF